MNAELKGKNGGGAFRSDQKLFQANQPQAVGAVGEKFSHDFAATVKPRRRLIVQSAISTKLIQFNEK